ncbi:MAG: acetyl-CoA carboxylase biotin carboxyl carrier protein [Acidobacteriia bacterium]|nr:acetyl-CoA carboxylase biotin carboxyl carrier protein [Terriglobia bacterium]
MAKKPKSSAGAGTDVRGVDLSEVERLLAFMQTHGLEEFEYQRAGVHIRLKRASAQAGGVRPAPPAEHAAAVAHAAAAGVREHAPEAAEAADVHVVKSPIVGTFYAAPSPNAEPFVTLGAKVAAGQVLCIIEAMKLMNEIESDVAGEVVRIFAENGKPVEYGEALFGIRTQGKK